MSKKIKVVIADDHTLLREGLVKIISIEPDITVIGEAEDGAQVIKLARTIAIDIVLMDINMPNVDGIQATKVIKSEKPDIGIIALTIHEQEEYLFEMIRCGVSGYLLKDVRSDDLINTIRGVADGQSFIPPLFTTKALKELNRLTGDNRKGQQQYHQYGLTNRELDILQQVALGRSNKEIAGVLYISEKTVKNHLTNIFQKLNVQGRTQAALWAVKNKLVDI